MVEQESTVQQGSKDLSSQTREKLKGSTSSSLVKGLSKTYTLNNGLKIPALGMGTWKSSEDKVYNAVKNALKAGYRHIDCAMAYGNQSVVGRALTDGMKEFGIKREELWITSKLWITCFEPDRAREALEQTLKDLKLDFLDLFLLHWPLALEYRENQKLGIPKDENGLLKLSYCPLYKTWQTMEEFVQQGKVRSIGVSNFEPSNLFDLLSYAKIKPVINQVEVHPMFVRKDMQRICEGYGIHVTAYSPFGNGVKDMFENQTLRDIGSKHNKTVGQVIIRWLIQRGLSTIPKSVHEERICQNLDIFDFELSDGDMERICGLDKHLRTCDSRRKDYWDFPFDDC